MSTFSQKPSAFSRCLAAIVVSLSIPTLAWGQQPKSSKDIVQKKKAEPEKSRPDSAPPARVQKQKVRTVVPPKKVRRHIRWAVPTDDHNEVDYRAVLTRSANSTGFSLEYYDEPRRALIDSAIRSFREDRRDEGYAHWVRFVTSLDTFDKPVDLEPVMYHVLREGCLREDPNVLYYAERMERARNDLGNIEEYWDDLYRLNRQCKEPRNLCREMVERRIEDELEILAQERDLARAKVGVAERDLERAQLTSSGEVTRSVDVFYNVAQELTRRTEIALIMDSD